MIYPATLLMPTGVTNSTITIQIAENSFLKNGAAFIVRLNSVQVESKCLIILTLGIILGNKHWT